MTAVPRVTPEYGVPYDPNEDYVDLKAKVEAACATAEWLEEHGMSPRNEEGMEQITNVAEKMLMAYAEDPEKTSKVTTDTAVASMSPAALKQIRSLLDDFGQRVVNNAVEIRNTVTNKLLIELDNPDPKIRIRAAELLGKISDVGLFIERKEVVHHEASPEEVQARLREKLQRVRQKKLQQDIDGVYEEVADSDADGNGA